LNVLAELKNRSWGCATVLHGVLLHRRDQRRSAVWVSRRLRHFQFLQDPGRIPRRPWANTPNWDLAFGCEIAGKTGLILVEAKANEPELTSFRKTARETCASRHDGGECCVPAR
jgi:hypothetical protein